MFKYIFMLTHCILNIYALFQFLLNPYECLYPVDHLLHQLHFGEPNPLLVGDVPLAARAGGGVLAAAAARLHAELLGEVLELVRGECLGQFGEENHR